MLTQLIVVSGLTLALQQTQELPPQAQEKRTETAQSLPSQFSSNWEYGSPTSSEDESESDAQPTVGSYLAEKLTPDPRGLFTSDDHGNLGLIGQADEICLGGLCARMNRRAYNYGLCGAFFGASIGCILAILPVYVCNAQISQISEQSGVTPPDISFLAIPAALLGAPPGCLVGAGTGSVAGILSAIFSPQDPSSGTTPDGDQNDGSTDPNREESVHDENEGSSNDEHKIIRKKKRPKKKKKRTSRESQDTSRSAQPIDTDSSEPARSKDRTKKTKAKDNRPSIHETKGSTAKDGKQDKTKPNDNRPEVPKDSSKVKDDKKKVKKKKDRKPSKPRRSEGELDPNNKSGNPLPNNR